MDAWLHLSESRMNKQLAWLARSKTRLRATVQRDNGLTFVNAGFITEHCSNTSACIPSTYNMEGPLGTAASLPCFS